MLNWPNYFKQFGADLSGLHAQGSSGYVLRVYVEGLQNKFTDVAHCELDFNAFDLIFS